MEDVDQSVKVATAAAILDCDQSLVRRLAKAGKLRWHKIGKVGVRIYLSSIQAYRELSASEMLDEPGKKLAQRAKTKAKKSAAYHEAEAFLRSMGVLD